MGSLALLSNDLLSKDTVSSQQQHPGNKYKYVWSCYWKLPQTIRRVAGAEMMVLFLPLDPTILKLGRYFELIHFYALHLSIFIMTEILFFPCWKESWDHNPYVKIFSLSACFCGLKTAFLIPIQSFYMIIVEKLKNKGGIKKRNKPFISPQVSQGQISNLYW